MTTRLSTGLVNNLVGPRGIAASFAGGVIDIYTGAQPANADSSIGGATLLGRCSVASATYSPETPATGTVTLSGAAGSILTLNVGTLNIIPIGPVPFVTDLATTAQELADAVNRNAIYTATASGAVVTLRAPAGTGDAHNGLAVLGTFTTLTATYTNISGGVDAVAGLQWGVPTNGSISKAGVLSFNGVAAGTAGWFRIKASALDNDAASTTLVRLDGSVATSGGDMNLSNLVIAIGAPTTIDSLVITMPKS